MTYDVIVVGARCAGSPTAMLLARAGYRVLLVDRARFPSDMVLSTHCIQHAGVALLQRWGLLDRLRATNCPALTTMTFHAGQAVLRGTPAPAGDVAETYCPRRTILDKILVDAAVEAGVDLWETCLVTGVLRDGERVTGIQATRRGIGKVSAESRLVIGADGMHSTIARAVGAAEYNTQPAITFTWFSYWSDVAAEGVETWLGRHRMAYAWNTNEGLALVGINWPVSLLDEVRSDVEGRFFESLSLVAPTLADRVRAGRRQARWLTGSVSNFFRTPFGPGWALVGDAGYKKDPVTAAGITHAFRDAQALVNAIDEGFSGRRKLEDSLAEHQRRRDEAELPFYKFTCDLARLEPPSAERMMLYQALEGNPEETGRFFGVVAQTVPVPVFFAPDNIRRILGA